MNRSLSLLCRGVVSCHSQKKAIINLALRKQIIAVNTFNNFIRNKVLMTKNVAYSFSKSHHRHGHDNKHEHDHDHHDHHHSSSDPIKQMRQQLQNLSSQVQLKHPKHPQLVIKQLYQHCQKLVGYNKKVEILMLFELICQFIESKNIIEQYSSFLVLSAGNSFMMGKYQQVQRRCRLALPFQLKKHGQKHKNIGDIYNMLGISISKSFPNKGSEALEYLQKAFTIRKQLHGQSGQAAQVLFNAGIIEQEAEKMLQRAEKNYLDAVQMLENATTPMPLLYIKTKMRLSQVQYKIHKVASKYISDMLRLTQMIQKYKNEKKFQEHQIPTIEMFSSMLHRNLGKKFLQSNDYPNSVKFFQKCLNYLRENQMQTQDRIQVLESCSIAFTNMNQFIKAAQLLVQSQRIVASFPGVTDQYKFHMWKFLSQIYRKTGESQKELNVLQKMRTLIKQTKQKFAQQLDHYETDICLIYCLGNLKMFDRVIEVGRYSLQALEMENSLPVDHLNDFLSNVSAYVGFAYLSKGQAEKALEYFTKSDEIFTRSISNISRYQFHSNILRKIALIHIQLKKDFIHGFEYLKRIRSHILGQKQLPLQKKLNDMVVLLLDYEIQTGENEQQIVQKLIQAKYIERINEVVGEIVKFCRQLSQQKQNKQILSNYYILIDSIYQMLISFAKIRDYQNKASDIGQTIQHLSQLINVYELFFREQIDQVKIGSFAGDEALRVNIKKALVVKQQLAK